MSSSPDDHDILLLGITACSEAYEGQRLLKRECTSGCDQAEKNFMKMYEVIYTFIIVYLHFN